MPPQVSAAPEVSLAEFQAARKIVSSYAYHSPLLTSRLLSEQTGFDVRLKAEMFQKGGSYKVRGPLNKFSHLTEEQKKRSVICSSAGNHAQGVALAAGVYKMKAVVVMASNATQSKVDATRAYGAEVVLHGMIWDEANEKSKQLCQERGLTYIHPFDDLQLITGQGTLGLEVYEDFPQIDVAIALKASNPKSKIIGVESSDGPGMKRSIEAGHVVTLDKIDCIIDGLRVKRVGENNFSIVQRFVDDNVTLPDKEIFDAMIWNKSSSKM